MWRPNYRVSGVSPAGLWLGAARSYNSVRYILHAEAKFTHDLDRLTPRITADGS